MWELLGGPGTLGNTLASCTSSCFNSLLTAPIEAAYSADWAVLSRGGPGAGADRRRPRRPRPPPPLLQVFKFGAGPRSLCRSRSVLQGGFNSSPRRFQCRRGIAIPRGALGPVVTAAADHCCRLQPVTFSMVPPRLLLCVFLAGEFRAFLDNLPLAVLTLYVWCVALQYSLGPVALPGKHGLLSARPGR